MAKGILIAAMDFSACPEDEFHDWYDLEHIPERLGVPGFINAERWIGSANGTPWTKRVTGRTRSIIRLEGEQIRPGDALAPDGAAALLLIAMNPAPEAESEFNEWYNTEHLPALGGVPGVLRARRYRGASATQRYAAI